ncbi:MAG: hypothetical protein ACFFDN_49905, partial [Candidatus Hodarchaeota archaeon]
YNFSCIGLRYNDKKVKFLHFILMKHYNAENQKNSLIIGNYIREMKIRYAFYHILKLVSPILTSKIKKDIREIFNHFLIFKLLLKPLNFHLIKWNLFTVILNIIKKLKKQIL